MVRILIPLFLALALAGTAAAGQADKLTALKRAAEAGIVDAQNDLGSRYMMGEGVKKNPELARAWFEKAAAQGHPYAQTVLGWLYMGGAGIKEDQVRAALWLRKAALQGTGEAQLSLGMLYVTGRGVPQNLVDAHMWFTLAEDRLPPKKRAEARYWRKSVSARMTRAEIDEARTQAEGLLAFQPH